VKTDAGKGQVELNQPPGSDLPSAPAGGLPVRELTKAQSYASSLAALAKAESNLDMVDQDLRLIKEALVGHMGLRKSLSDPTLTPAHKQAVVEEVFGSKVSPTALNFLQLLVGMGRIDILPDAADAFARLLQSEENKVVAEVTTAIPLEGAFADRLAARLSELTGQEVTIRSRVDADIIGGIVVRIDGKLLDGSVRHQLGRMRDQMLMDIRGR
jgi:F-type H+-transporting ATPase subunit delta